MKIIYTIFALVGVFLICSCKDSIFTEQEKITFLSKPILKRSETKKWQIFCKIPINSFESKYGFYYYCEDICKSIPNDYCDTTNLEPYFKNLIKVTDVEILDGNLIGNLSNIAINKKFKVFSYYQSNENGYFIKSESDTFSTPIESAKIEANLTATNCLTFHIKLSPSLLPVGDIIRPKLLIDTIDKSKGITEGPSSEGDYSFLFKTDSSFYYLSDKAFYINVPLSGEWIRDTLFINYKTKVFIDSISFINNYYTSTARTDIDHSKPLEWDSIYYIQDSLFLKDNIVFSKSLAIEKDYQNIHSQILMYKMEGINFNCNYKYVFFGKHGKYRWLSNIINKTLEPRKPDIITFQKSDSTTATNISVKWDIKPNGIPLKKLTLYIDNTKKELSTLTTDTTISHLKPNAKYTLILEAMNNVGFTSDTLIEKTKDTIPPCILTISNLTPISAQFIVEVEKINDDLRGDNMKGIYLFTSNTDNPVASITSNVNYKNEKQYFELKFNPIFEKRPFQVFARIINRNEYSRETNKITVSSY